MPESNKKGRFIVIEGLEGAGKSTAVDNVIQFLESHEIPCIKTREPGGTKIGECLRNLIKSGLDGETLFSRAELLLIYAARLQLLEQVVRPALKAGTWVVTDRFELSTFAYQGGGRQLDMAMIEELSAFCLQGLKPDQVFFLDILPEQGLMRAKARGEMDKIEQESRAFFSRVYHTYHERLAMMQHVKIIPATLSIEQVREQMHATLAQMIHETILT
jgi:dTMP kinase